MVKKIPNKNESFWETVVAVAAVALIFVFMLVFLSSCKLFREVDKAKSDSASVVKQSEVNTKVDTSKSKTETIHTKETIYQPQPIYIQGKDGETKVIFVPQTTRETGSQTQENTNYKFDGLRKEFLDSLNVAKASKQSETKAGTDWFQIAMLAALVLLVFKNFLAPYISFKR